MSAIKKIWKTKELRNRIFYTLAVLIFIRAVSQITVPGVDPSVLKGYFDENEAFSLMNTFTGGGLENLSVFALSISPYITASIVIQLFTFSFPRLEQLAREGEEGRKKLTKYTQVLAFVLSILTSVAMAVGLKDKVLINDGYLSIAVASATLTAGSMILVWLGSRITEKGLGNGVSMILLFNILSKVPQDMISLYNKFMAGRETKQIIVAGALITIVILLVIWLTIGLYFAERRIPVVYTKRTKGRRQAGDGGANIPLKVNTSGVMPVIFATSLMSMPSLLAALLRHSPQGGFKLFTSMMNPNNWFNPENWVLTCGYAVYVILLFFFAYFYAGVTFNPAEIANNLKRAGANIPDVRAGEDTEIYLKKALKRVVVFGACGLLVICTVPLVVNGLTRANVSFGGTSLVIIVSVTLEAVKQGSSLLSMKNANTFLR